MQESWNPAPEIFSFQYSDFVLIGNLEINSIIHFMNQLILLVSCFAHSQLTSNYGNMRDLVNDDDIIAKLQQSTLHICKLAASLTWQKCKLQTSYCKLVGHHASTLQQAFCSNTLQIIAETEYADEPQIRIPDNQLPKSVALATQPAGPRLRMTDCVNRSCIYTFSFKLSS
ncbi:hypothetical protein AVEN_112373-1 [Araneus ventricosus]|uniref:Uncharacterized protein n=1 Tax=Araneus ventricosus TaxID=182803 RepID=A0A4Y2SL94_ARAVE|nr:hypothetical protein AVEN_112373-1 [Araneus ventricosus]